MGLIFILDSKRRFCEDLERFLISEEQEVVNFSSCKDLSETLKEIIPTLLILDPVEDGFAGYELIKEYKNKLCSFLFLSSTASTSDRIFGLEMGAVDYIPVSYPQKEINLRIKNVLKWLCPASVNHEKTQTWLFRDNEIVFNLDTYKLLLNGNEIKLTKSEWNIFYLLCLNNSIGVSRDKITAECLQKKKNGYKRIVDGHIKRIRSKLALPEAIVVLRGYGYMFIGNKT